MLASDWADAIQAAKSSLIGIPYSKLDCQAFVEYCLRNYAGIVKDWRGSNDMWRNAVTDRSEDFDLIEPGEWVFTVKHDGKEPSRYTDGVNAAHVGIYIGYGEVIHSTTGGVQMDKISNAKRWTHHAKAKCLTYTAGQGDEALDKDYKSLYENLYNGIAELMNKYGG